MNPDSHFHFLGPLIFYLIKFFSPLLLFYIFKFSFNIKFAKFRHALLFFSIVRFKTLIPVLEFESNLPYPASVVPPSLNSDEKSAASHLQAIDEYRVAHSRSANIWQLGYDLAMSTSLGGCSVEMGAVGPYYYKYYPFDGDCSTQISTRAVKKAIDNMSDGMHKRLIYNSYSQSFYHNWAFNGTLIIGPSINTWMMPLSNTIYLGYFRFFS
ncbi:unnamed protein product [Ambrosiozyma monospora]|uniref:Unnamed protein product n=1 Tax=Ambrosiozyma monospora TaxID=43982 RepID=A0A9W6Z1H9_AMBMO|nr:unnamed protein product [Ambrosiozyma monospora]